MTDVIVINENRDKPDGFTLCHLPDGPTAVFKLRSVKLTKEIKVCWYFHVHLHLDFKHLFESFWPSFDRLIRLVQCWVDWLFDWLIDFMDLSSAGSIDWLIDVNKPLLFFSFLAGDSIFFYPECRWNDRPPSGSRADQLYHPTRPHGGPHVRRPISPRSQLSWPTRDDISQSARLYFLPKPPVSVIISSIFFPFWLQKVLIEVSCAKITLFLLLYQPTTGIFSGMLKKLASKSSARNSPWSCALSRRGHSTRRRGNFCGCTSSWRWTRAGENFTSNCSKSLVLFFNSFFVTKKVAYE